MANTESLILPTDPAAIKKIMGKMGEIDASYHRMGAERDLIKTTLKDLADEFELPKKHLGRFARDYHKNSFRDQLNSNDDYEAIVAALVPSAIE